MSAACPYPCPICDLVEIAMSGAIEETTETGGAEK